MVRDVRANPPVVKTATEIAFTNTLGTIREKGGDLYAYQDSDGVVWVYPHGETQAVRASDRLAKKFHPEEADRTYGGRPRGRR